MLDRERVIEAFCEVLSEVRAAPRPRVRPRTVALRAYEVYCEGLEPGEKRPALVTFRMFVAGKSALPEIIHLLKGANILPASRAKLDRLKVKAVFEEAVRRLETRLLKGQAKPLQIARRAYELYTRDEGDLASRPSPHTFARLIYGKAADPEILELIQTARRGKD